MSATRLFVGVRAVDAVDPANRGLAYGDGLFETMRVCGGDVHWRDRHWSRLQHGAQRLGLALPDAAFVREQAADVLRDHDDGVLKLLLTRGSGGRGYALPRDAEPAWQLAWHPLPAIPTSLELIWCEQRIGWQPRLAGLKHCNRLEQVLARREVEAAQADEGLMLDQHGHVVCATSANLFILDEEGWATPPLETAGVAGICRDWVLSKRQCRIALISAGMVERAHAVFLCNAVRGILPVHRLGPRRWASHPGIHALQRALGDAHPAFAARSDN